MESNYDLLIRKIDEFIRKYYKNKLIRGLLYTLAALGVYFLVLIAAEYISWFGTTTRSLLFYTYLLAASVIAGRLIVIPLLQLARLGKVISHEQAAGIIGKHFGEVKDVLLNTLQLHRLQAENPAGSDLIRSSIDQRISRLKPVPFAEAVDLKQNRKYLKFALPPLLLIIAGLLVSPTLITAPSARLIRHNTVFERPAPFTVKVLNDTLQAVQQDDFTVKVKIEGDEIPAGLFIQANNANYRMEKKSNVLYSYTFRNLQQDTRFILNTDQYNSREYVIKVLPKPIILSFDVLAEYPGYTGRKNETLPNTGDLTVPAGTKLTWKFYTRDTRRLLFRIGGNREEITAGNSNTFSKSVRMLASSPYSVYIGNDYFQNRDSLTYLISVIPDLYPSIDITEVKDSVYDNRLYYQGLIKDDYGFSKLEFCYAVTRAGDKNQPPTIQTRPITVDRALLQQQFFYYLDISALMVQPGDVVEYYFEVWDNDGATGSKSTRTVKRVFKVPTLGEIEKMTTQKSTEIKEKMESVIRQSKSLQRQVEDMQKKMVDKKEVGWQEKQTLKQLLEKQQSLEEQVRQIENENKEKRLLENEYRDADQQIIEKQKRLEELFDKVLPDELKKMYQELQQMLDQVDKDKVADMLEKMKSDNKELEKELDRNLELFKQLEVEQKLQEAIDKLKDLSDEQQKLSEQAKNASKEQSEQLKQKQDDLNSKFDALRENLNDLEKKNGELEDPKNLQNTDPQEQDIENDMQNSSQELQNSRPQKASPSQKNASDKMQKLGEKLEQMQSDMEEEENGEDIETLRQILDNLVKISFDQEDIMDQLGVINTVNPKYLQIIQKQKNLIDDLRVVSDSLYALSRRQSSIEPFVMRELTTVQRSMDEATKMLNSRSVAPAKTKQQYAMTSVNNLALLLSDAMKQMEQNMQASGSGKSGKQCSKPKSGQGKMKSMRQLQEKLNQQLKEMRDGTPQNKQDAKGQRQMSEKLARMAAQQEELRRQMQEYGQQLQNETGKDDKALKEMMKQMEQTETDLVNKRISIETLKRQQEIVTRMLESEKAEQQRELDEERESEEGRDLPSNTAAKYLQFNKLKNNETELIRTVPPNFKPFFKNKVNAYFLSFDK